MKTIKDKFEDHMLNKVYYMSFKADHMITERLMAMGVNEANVKWEPIPHEVSENGTVWLEVREGTRKAILDYISRVKELIDDEHTVYDVTSDLLVDAMILAVVDILTDAAKRKKGAFKVSEKQVELLKKLPDEIFELSKISDSHGDKKVLSSLRRGGYVECIGPTYNYDSYDYKLTNLGKVTRDGLLGREE